MVAPESSGKGHLSAGFNKKKTIGTQDQFVLLLQLFFSILKPADKCPSPKGVGGLGLWGLPLSLGYSIRKKQLKQKKNNWPPKKCEVPMHSWAGVNR